MSERNPDSIQEDTQDSHLASELANQGDSDQTATICLENDEEFSLDNFSEPAVEAPVAARKNGNENKSEDETLTQFDSFKNTLDAVPSVEMKLQKTLEFMEMLFTQKDVPYFRSFWKARVFCLPLFKENIPASSRSLLWNKLQELSKEARRLKEILDEQSAFAVEQIEIAIQALEENLSQFDDLSQKAHVLDSCVFPSYLADQQSIYIQLQNKLHILNLQAMHINALRKELLKTDMRVRQKNKFFQRLSLAGDHVFPKRKELIVQISQQFFADVDHFIQLHFGPNPSNESFYILREDIKALQGLAKLLTLNTQTFTQTRMHLSQAWDRIRNEEKERKKERVQQRLVFKQNAQEMMGQIQAVHQQLTNGELSFHEASKKNDALVTHMRQIELGREEVKVLREELGKLRQLIQEKKKSDEDNRYQAENARIQLKKEQFQKLKNQAEHLIQQADQYEIEQIINEKEQILNLLQETALNKMERQEIERLIKPLRDIITDKKENDLLKLSEDDRQNLQQFQTILKQRRERKQEVKAVIDDIKRATSTSGLDFEKAITLNVQLNEEKERLDKINQGIKEIEMKIAHVQSQIKNK